MGTLAVDNIQHTDGSSAVTLNNANITNLSSGVTFPACAFSAYLDYPQLPTGQGGIWLFNVGVLLGSATDSIIRGYQLMLFNGSTFLEEDAQRYAGNDVAVVRGKLSTIASVSAGDVLEVRVQSNTTTNANTTAHASFYNIPHQHMNNVVDRSTIFNGTKLGTA